MNIADIFHTLATAERALAEGSVALALPMARDALRELGVNYVASRDAIADDVSGADVALRMRDTHELLHRMRSILNRAPEVYGSEAAEAIDTVRAAG